MTESSRNGEPHPYDQQPPLYHGSEPAYSAPEPQVHATTPYEPSPFGDERVVPSEVVASHSSEPGTPPAGDGAGGFPPPPPYGPGYAAMPGGPAPHRRRRLRKPAVLFAAVALAAGVIGGGAGALIGNATDHSTSTTAAPAVNASAIDGSVAGVAKALSPSVVEINATSASGKSTGSGVIITSDGQVVTNNHVVAGADTVTVTYSNGKSARASVVGTDSGKDLALIKITGASGLPAAVLGDSNGIAVGDQVVAIGSPDGLSGTVTSGIVSALNRDVTVSTNEGQGQQFGGNGNSDGRWPFSFGGNQYNGDTGSSTTTYKAIQTDASLNPGNSGGALINMSGQIIGINSAMYSDSSSSGSSSAGSVGLGFAIPVNTVKADLATLRAGGTSGS
ncbi:MAG: trypsin-like peptidase domain-containing protein [Actinomycetia bacterium]|nr:trypsin-like peptidase domain-containing protein [Actinomycetes bacterium]MCL2730031.1 trypsin-like peptidase domain-containing protein [Actinomycetes bacterium]